MNRLFGIFAFLIPLLAMVGLAGVQAADRVDSGWDTTVPRGKTKTIDFTTQEGTWMSVDLSPDGRWIVFDLLGHIYRMPASGGEAVSLTQDSGIALNLHPAISPKGDRIAFVSDRNGQNGLWVMDADGGRPRQIFMEPANRISEPAWLPDGSAIVAVRAFPTPGRGWHRQNTRLWLFPLDGSAPRELVGDNLLQYNAPVPAVDGSLYFHVSAFSGNRYGSQIGHRVQRLAPGKKVPEDVVAFERPGAATPTMEADDTGFIPEDPPAAIQPRPSPDGRWLAYAREQEEPTVIEGHSISPGTYLFVRDLKTGVDRRIAPMTKDLSAPHALYSYRVLPSYAWSSDGRFILYTEGGKIRRVDVATGFVSTIPFIAKVHRTISEQVRGQQRLNDESFAPALLQWPASSPDGRSVAFVTAGRLWTASLPDGEAKEIPTASPGAKMTPAWSPSGREIAYTSWDDSNRGHVWIQPLGQGGRPRKVSALAGEYIFPSFSPDGRSLLVTRGALENPAWDKWSDAPSWDVVLIPLDGRPERVVAATSGPRAAYFGADGRIYFEHQNDRKAAQGLYSPFPDDKARAATVSVRSVDLTGSGERIHANFPARGIAFSAANLPLLSADGKWIAFQAARDIYVAPASGAAGRPAEVEPDPNIAMPGKRRLSPMGGIFHRWRNAEEVEFIDGRDHVAVDARTGRETRTPIRIRLKGNAPDGRLALVNARIIPIHNDEVIERGSIIVDRGRISCVGKCDAKGADKLVDLRGKTVIPGLVDVHAHATHLPVGIVPTHLPQLGVQLAYGVTSTVDPATDSSAAFPLQDMVAAGVVRGPRIFSVAEIVNSGPATGFGDQLEIQSLADAQRQAQRRSNWGAVALKNFRIARRDQVQKLIEAARHANLTVTGEGGPVEYVIGLAMDGQTGWEHYIANLPIYSDVARFLGMAGMTYSPTVGVTGHGRGSIDFWRPRHNIGTDRKYTALVPEEMIPNSEEVTAIRPITEFTFPVVASGLAAMRRAGGYGAIGDHAEQSGIGSHWEVWSYAAAMSPMDALRLGTLEGARFHGLDLDVGSIEVGKLADLIILDSNPLDDIRNTLDIDMVVLGGRLYDPETVDEIWPTRRSYGPLPWKKLVPGQVIRTGSKPHLDD
ncbi:amidohydrolase family protein [Sphingosinicella rhizophila]|uniref:Amidohydrolase family protein n=1 Tax=Sphingosinicella rhizophila TaxID=3050082 RepID=A0ABU3QBM4_9SPHN|nr:amidohydrolase family protein [Sphingosinicella sp. GR2756]MDT9600355.1 amidohydrolase family protein [Sphingosinicella sp. GR2756]